MMAAVFKCLSCIFSVIQFFAKVLIIFLGLGLVGIFFEGQRMGGTLLFSNGEYDLKIPIVFPILILWLTIMGTILMVFILQKWSDLFMSFSTGYIFNQENDRKIMSSLFLLIFVTFFQLLINVVINFMEIYNVSGLFDFSINFYVLNCFLIIIHIVLVIVFKKAKIIQDENEEFI